ncbi:MAG: hypothetical protein J7J52_04690 [Deltaproteobacteria bacterium]|nr:hypothetical protein [Deltaproteobacteria bacterium]
MNLTVEALQHYSQHPVDFCQDLIEGVDFDRWQIEAFDALTKYRFIAIRSGSGVGKTVFLSLATLWFLATKPFARIPSTAPSQHQLYDLLWSEHSKWIHRSKFLRELLSWTQSKVAVRHHEARWFAIARTAKVSPDGQVAEGLQGFHAESKDDNLLFIVDEASGVPDAVFPAVEGAFTSSNSYCILAGNPTRLSGYFHSVFNDLRMKKQYRLFHVSCYDSSFVSERYLRMMETRYGKDHPIFQIKVLGDFPSRTMETLFAPEDIETFRNRTKSKLPVKNLPIEIGVDVGRTSSKSVMCIRQGFNILEFRDLFLTGGVVDTLEVTEWVAEAIRSYEPKSVKIDFVGIGAGVYDNLKALFPKIVVPVAGNAQVPPDLKDRYTNLRAQGYWNLRSLLPHLFCRNIPDRFLEEISDIRVFYPNGKVQIESKADMVKRCGHSPDYADAAMYAFLDSRLCATPDRIVEPIPLGKVNTDLEKLSLWGKMKFEPKFPKWSALHL